MKKNKNNIGFTLIELVIVIGVLAILASFMLAIVNPAAQFQKADDARRKADLSQIQKALEQYYQDNGQYPAVQNNEIVNFQGQPIVWGTTWTPYMTIVPKDPQTNRTYVYYAKPDHQSYWLYASLERGTGDTQACNTGGACTSLTSNNIATTACGATCNFGLTSPNVSP